MNENIGSFNSIDMFTLKYFQIFGFTLKLLFEFESRSIKFHPDTNDFFTQLVNEKSLVNQFIIQ